MGEVAAIGMPDQKWGERPLLLIVPVETADPSGVERAVKQYSPNRWMLETCQNGRFRRDQFVPEIAKTSVGKIDKKRFGPFCSSWLDRPLFYSGCVDSRRDEG